MSTIFDYVTAPEMAAYITKETSNAIPYLGETLFPSKKQVGTNISWLTGADGLPIAIQPSNFDAKATLRERTAFGKMETEMAFFREAMRIGEKDRQEINKLLNHPNSTIALPIIKNIFDDVKKLVDGVNAQAEIMRMELLQGGTITVKGVNNGASYKYDYKMALEHIKTVTNKWDVPATSDPINDIMEMQNLIEEETGIRPTRCIMNRQTFLQMIKSESLRKLMYPNITSGMISKIIVTEAQVKTYVEETLSIKLVVYSKKVAQLGKDGLQGATVQLIKDGNVVLLPEGNIGYTWYGTTPEESDLLAGGTDAQVSLIKNATAITTYKEKHPVNVMTIVSSVMIPSFESINNVAVLKVLS
jgi:Phage major capsid protein E.